MTNTPIAIIKNNCLVATPKKYVPIPITVDIIISEPKETKLN